MLAADTWPRNRLLLLPLLLRFCFLLLARLLQTKGMCARRILFFSAAAAEFACSDIYIYSAVRTFSPNFSKPPRSKKCLTFRCFFGRLTLNFSQQQRALASCAVPTVKSNVCALLGPVRRVAPCMFFFVVRSSPVVVATLLSHALTVTERAARGKKSLVLLTVWDSRARSLPRYPSLSRSVWLATTTAAALFIRVRCRGENFRATRFAGVCRVTEPPPAAAGRLWRWLSAAKLLD